MHQVQDLLIRTWMPILSVIWHILKWLHRLYKGHAQAFRNDTIRLENAVGCLDNIRGLEENRLDLELSEALSIVSVTARLRLLSVARLYLGEHGFRHVHVRLVKYFTPPFLQSTQNPRSWCSSLAYP